MAQPGRDRSPALTKRSCRHADPSCLGRITAGQGIRDERARDWSGGESIAAESRRVPRDEPHRTQSPLEYHDSASTLGQVNKSTSSSLLNGARVTHVRSRRSARRTRDHHRPVDAVTRTRSFDAARIARCAPEHADQQRLTSAATARTAGPADEATASSAPDQLGSFTKPPCGPGPADSSSGRSNGLMVYSEESRCLLHFLQ